MEVACRSKEDGGLGILDLKTYNTTLLLKFLGKFYTKMDIPWVSLTWKCLYRSGTLPHERQYAISFWCRHIMALSLNFFMVASCKVHRGDPMTFSNDQWDLGVIKWRYPQLFSFSKKTHSQIQSSLSLAITRSFGRPSITLLLLAWRKLICFCNKFLS